MSRIMLRYTNNKDAKFLHIANFLIGCGLMTLEETHSLYKNFKSRNDIIFDIPDEMASEFRNELDSLNCKYE